MIIALIDNYYIGRDGKFHFFFTSQNGQKYQWTTSSEKAYMNLTYARNFRKKVKITGCRPKGIYKHAITNETIRDVGYVRYKVEED